MDSRRTGSLALFRWALRSHRVGVLVCGAGLGVMHLITAPAYAVAAKAIGGGLKQLGDEAMPLAQGLQFLTGPVERLDTYGGYISYKVFPTTAVILAIYATLQGAQVLRGAEARGLFDLWYSAGLTRGRIFRDRVLAFLVALLAILALVWAGTTAGLALTGENDALPALGQCIAVGLVALFAFALGLAVSQLFVTTRATTTAVSVYIVAAYFIANIAGELGPAAFLRFLSPFHWYIQSRTLVPGISFDVAAAALTAAASAALAAAAWILYRRRDADAPAFPQIERTRPASYAFRPSRVVRRRLWLAWITEQPGVLLWWFIGITAFSTVEAWVVPAAMRIVENGGSQFKQYVATHGGVLTPETYLAAMMEVAAVMAVAFVAGQVTRWGGDARQHRVDAVLSQPVSTERFLIERMASLMVAALVGVGGGVALGVWSGAAMGGYGIDAAGLGRTVLDLVLLCFAAGGVGLLAVTLLRNGGAGGVVAAVVVASLFVSTLVGLLGWPDWAARPSLLDAFASPYLAMPDGGRIAYMLVLGAAGTLLAGFAMHRGARIAA